MEKAIKTAKPQKSKPFSRQNIRKLTVTAILSAVAAVLMFLDFSTPLMPSFIKMDVSDFPALIASFALGPVSGVMVCLIKNLINLMTTSTGGVGELSNFILGCMLVVLAGLIYKHKKTRSGAFIGALVGALCMAVVSFFSNMYLVYPVYTNFMPMEMIIKAYNTILPSVTTLWQALLIFNVPFTFIKGLLCTVITFVLYKRLSPILKGRNE